MPYLNIIAGMRYDISSFDIDDQAKIKTNVHARMPIGWPGMGQDSDR